MTIDYILQPNPVVTRDAALVRAAAQKLGTRWRMTEGNTCYRGGKPGVSDIFAAALWAADYMLELVSLGYAGVNLHGGDGQMVANSLGGKLPGDDMVTDDPATHPHPYYTPIAHIGQRYVAEPVSFGMRFAQHFAGSQLSVLDLDSQGGRISAYSGQKGSSLLVGVINKQPDRPFIFSVDLPGTHSRPHLELTSAPSLSSAEVKISTGPTPAGPTQTVPPASLALFTYLT